MNDFRSFFKDKKITVMGLGILGRGLGYTKFLAECGADLIVTDLKTKEQLATSVKALEKYKNIKFILGEHKLEDFQNRDMIIKSAGVPLDSVYIAEARKNNIPIEMDVSLFAKLAPEVEVVGVTGTRGKSMTTTLIYEILKKNEKFLNPSSLFGTKRRKVFLGGNVRGVATLPLLEKIKAGDILVCELDSWQLQGFGEAGISPHISVFTSFMPDHMNYYGSTTLTTGKAMERYFADKANIFKYQKSGDVLIIRPEMEKLIFKNNVMGKLVIANAKDVEKYKFIVPGEHQKGNLACAVAVAQVFGVPDEIIKKTVKNFKGLEGRLQYLKTIKGVKIYNDNNATTPEATIAGIEALSGTPEVRPMGAMRDSHRSDLWNKKIILICGGSDKNLDLVNLADVINKHCKAVVLIPGTGTEKLASFKLKVLSYKVESLREAVEEAIKQSKKSDIILFSPAFASFGMFNNEYERNDLFMKIIKEMK